MKKVKDSLTSFFAFLFNTLLKIPYNATDTLKLQNNTNKTRIQNLIKLVKPIKLDFQNQDWKNYHFQFGVLKAMPGKGFFDLKPEGATLNFKRKKSNFERGKANYPEYIAKSYTPASNQIVDNSEEGFYTFLKSQESKPTNGPYKCTRVYLHGNTSKSNYLKAITCGKDWCRDCGKMGSTTHLRRINPILRRFKALQHSGKKIGYLVITIPDQIRNHFKDKQALADFRDYWKRKLKREGFPLGVIRYHWAGNDGYHFAPHLNILMPSGFLKLETLETWRKELSHWFSEYCGLHPEPIWNPETKKMEKDFPKSNLYYHYLKPDEPEAEAKLYHWVKYIFRATQTKRNKETESIIYKFRNTSVFGKKSDWPKLQLTEEEAEEQALKGFEFDPETGECEKIEWEKVYSEEKEKFVPYHVPNGYYKEEELEKVGPGFYKRTKPHYTYKPPNSAIKTRPPEISIKDIDWNEVSLYFSKQKLVLDKDFCPF